NGAYIEADDNREVGNSLGFVLAAKGYDVWLANARGNINSKKHKTLNAKNDEQFWKFSMDQMIEHDLPAQIAYIRKVCLLIAFNSFHPKRIQSLRDPTWVV